MIHQVIKNLGSGSITIQQNEEYSFTYDYLVITDHQDTPQSIYEQAESKGLPVSGDQSETGIPLQSISIDRWDQGNLKCVPSSKLPIKSSGSYAAWRYQVTYQTVGGDSQSAKNFNANIKQYQQSTNQFYYLSRHKVPNLQRQYTKRNTIIQNSIGDYLMYQTQLKNLVVTLDYSIQASKVSEYTSKYIPQYVGSVSKDDITIAGIPFKAGKVRLNSMTVSGSTKQKAANQTSAQTLSATVHIQLEMAVQKPVAFQIFPDMSHYCLFKTSKGLRKIRVQKWTASQRAAERVPSDLWLDKQKGLGVFSQSDDPKFVRGTHYQYYQDKIILDKSGFYYKTPVGKAPDIDDPNLGKTYVVTSPLKSWKGLNFPSKLK